MSLQEAPTLEAGRKTPDLKAIRVHRENKEWYSTPTKTPYRRNHANTR